MIELYFTYASMSSHINKGNNVDGLIDFYFIDHFPLEKMDIL